MPSRKKIDKSKKKTCGVVVKPERSLPISYEGSVVPGQVFAGAHKRMRAGGVAFVIAADDYGSLVTACEWLRVPEPMFDRRIVIGREGEVRITPISPTKQSMKSKARKGGMKRG